MFKIAIPKENTKGDNRVPVLPEVVDAFIKLGAEVNIESSLGEPIYIKDEDYKVLGANIVSDRKKLLSEADLVLKLNKPDMTDVNLLKRGALHISYLDPFNDDELVQKMLDQGVNAISMEMIPRSTRAQKMDSLSSQASLAGYSAVLLAAQKINKIFPMMMTPAGTIAPSKVFIIGAGVAGLQAIATAKRLGARVEAFDTRPVVEEQVQSLGAKFVKIDLGESGQTEDGYAKELTPEQLELQRQGMAKKCAQSDIVITTAQVFGRKAPLIITKEMIAGMKPGSIVIDMAVSTGGNVEGSAADKEVDFNGVTVIGVSNLPGEVAYHASQMYSSNLKNFVSEFWDKEAKNFNLNLEDEIIKSCLVTHDGAIFSDRLINKK